VSTDSREDWASRNDPRPLHLARPDSVAQLTDLRPNIPSGADGRDAVLD
jgi:hypothetical protein